MRLICPQCGAQYEVASDAIPAAGRDVQCSNCGRTWFETVEGSAEGSAARARAPDPEPERAPAGDAPAAVQDDDEEADDLAAIEADWSEPEWPRPDGPEAGQGEIGQGEPDAELVSAADSPAPTAPEGPPPHAPSPPRSTVSPQVAEILREEAARAAAERASEPETAAVASERVDGQVQAAAAAIAPPIATMAAAASPADPDASHPARDRQRAEEARRRMARLRGEAAPATSAVVASPSGMRRDRLPDIEEVSSTLRPASERRGGTWTPGTAAVPARRGGFRLGLGGVLLLAVTLALVYAYAPRIVAAVPATASILTPYAATVDEGRLWLDLRLKDLLRVVGGEPAAAPTPAAGEPPVVLTEDPTQPAPSP